MNKQIEQIILFAKSYVGIKENPPNSNNVIFNTRYYGKPVSGSAYPWCCATQWCLFQDIGAPELFYGGKKTASCTELMNYAKANGLFYTSGFRPGDLALFDFDNDKRKSEHIGLIVEVGKDYVISIEGNTGVGNDADGGMVMERKRSNNLIIGVYRPKYKEDEEEVTLAEFKKLYKEMMEEQGKLSPADLGTAANNEYKEASKDNLITDGTRPQAPVTRQEAAIMAYRAMKKAK